MMLLRKIVAPQYICSVHFNSHTLVPHSYANNANNYFSMEFEVQKDVQLARHDFFS